MQAFDVGGDPLVEDRKFLDEAIELAFTSVEEGGRPFGALVVKDGEIISRGTNRMMAENDPTAHAELLALREAGAALATTRLDGCTIYASGQPCPMCLAAIRLSGISRLVHGFTNEDGEPYGLSTASLYEEFRGPLDQINVPLKRLKPCAEQQDLYKSWYERKV